MRWVFGQLLLFEKFANFHQDVKSIIFEEIISFILHKKGFNHNSYRNAEKSFPCVGVFGFDTYCLQAGTVCCEVELWLAWFEFLNINWMKQQILKVYPTWVASLKKLFGRDTAVGDTTVPERNSLL